MKKTFLIFIVLILFSGIAFANAQTVEINDAEFEIPQEYQNGDLSDDMYRYENIFSIRCIDENIPNAIGLWASECDSSNDLSVDNHPVRHFCQYNKYVDGDHSHAYFASGDSVYEISWKGSEINKDIKKLIKNTPESEINEDDFYNVLDESVDIYKQQKTDKLNRDGEYNYLEAKYQSQQQPSRDDTRFNEILLTYYNK